MLCHWEKEGNYERRGCNVITAGPIVSVEAQSGLPGALGARCLPQHWAFIGPVRFLKRTRGQKTPGSQGPWLALSRQQGHRVVWEETRGQARASPPTGPGHPRLLTGIRLALPRCEHQHRGCVVPSPTGPHSLLSTNGQRMWVALCQCGLEKLQRMGRAVWLLVPLLPPSGSTSETSPWPGLPEPCLRHLKYKVLNISHGNFTKRVIKSQDQKGGV